MVKYASTEKTIHEVGKQADYVLDNNGTGEELEKQIDLTIQKILNK